MNMYIKDQTSHPAIHFQWLYWSVNFDHHNNTQVEVDPETGKSLRVDFRFLPWNRCGVLIQQVNSMIITKKVLWWDMSQGIVYFKKHCGNCECCPGHSLNVSQPSKMRWSVVIAVIGMTVMVVVIAAFEVISQNVSIVSQKSLKSLSKVS